MLYQEWGRPANIIVGDDTCYDACDGPEKFEEHVTHHYEFLGDRPISGELTRIRRLNLEDQEGKDGD